MQSLRKRPTYNEVVDYLENEQPKIKYPDRRATFLRNSPYLSQFDGDSWIDLEEQEQNINKEKLKELMLKEMASQRGLTAQALRTQTRSYSSGSPRSSRTDTQPEDYDSAIMDFLSDVGNDEREQQQARASILERGRQMFGRMLGQTEEQVARPEYLPEQQPTQEQLPSLENVSSSSTAMPHGINPVPLPSDEKQTEAYWFKKTIPEIKNELDKMGITVKGSGMVKSDWVDLIIKEMRKKK